MSISARALLTAIHGMLFGGFFLMAIFATAVELFRRRFESQPALLTAAGRSWERIYLIATAAAGWAAVLLGAYVVYPWYRALPPPGLADLAAFPQALLKSSPATAGWHNLGMEWKEHVAWFAPMAMTAVAYALLRCRRALETVPELRRAMLGFALVALFAACVAGFFGAMINKAAPVNGGAVIHLAGGEP